MFVNNKQVSKTMTLIDNFSSRQYNRLVEMIKEVFKLVVYPYN